MTFCGKVHRGRSAEAAHAHALDAGASPVGDQTASCEQPTLGITRVEVAVGPRARLDRSLELCFRAAPRALLTILGPAPIPHLKLSHTEAVTEAACCSPRHARTDSAQPRIRR